MKRIIQLVASFALLIVVSRAAFGDLHGMNEDNYIGAYGKKYEIDKSSVVWKDTSEKGLMVESAIHRAEIEGSKSRYDVMRIEFDVAGVGRFTNWRLDVLPKNRDLGGSCVATNGCYLRIVFSKSLYRPYYRVETIHLGAPDRQKLGSIRKESLRLESSCVRKKRPVLSNDAEFIIDLSSFFESYGGTLALPFLSSDKVTVIYKKSDGKRKFVKYDLSELGQIETIMKDEAKNKFGEDVQFLFLFINESQTNKQAGTKSRER